MEANRKMNQWIRGRLGHETPAPAAPAAPLGAQAGAGAGTPPPRVESKTQFMNRMIRQGGKWTVFNK